VPSALKQSHLVRSSTDKLKPISTTSWPPGCGKPTTPSACRPTPG